MSVVAARDDVGRRGECAGAQGGRARRASVAPRPRHASTASPHSRGSRQAAALAPCRARRAASGRGRRAALRGRGCCGGSFRSREAAVVLEPSMCSLAALARGCRPAAAKPCCLCWCCCCSCSWSAARGSDGGPGKKPREPGPSPTEPLLDGDAPPSIDEIRAWGQSFERLMRSAAGRKVFRDFLRGEYSEENIMFWLACEELKRETDPDAVEEKARFIYEDYISILSPKEVSLDSRVREAVNRSMVEPTPHTFDEAQLQIYTLMHRDSYPRFVNSPLYKTLARLAGPSPAAASAAPEPDAK
ncbi:unnamed protein product [Leptosia nina]|uniref:RGS domain-containing protein n=1 Tax=Leptosia nina TaxID=320188 RepID=A0AAV1J4F2_9NEOP